MDARPWLTPMLNPVSSENYHFGRRASFSGRSGFAGPELSKAQNERGAHGGSKYKLMASKKMEYCRNLISSERNWKMEEYSKADQERNKELQCGTSVNNSLVELLFTLISHHKANMGLQTGDRHLSAYAFRENGANRWQRRGQIYLAITDFQIISKGYRIIAYKHANTIAETEEMQF
ncbi:hypothetical protein OIU74_020259 [Salix koriyanagi]|uniref:Uncharacterized protein n=1 Tax=Salix koriyanagi TaxID=2511006 RepID=A0A9Q0P5F2_9ROSI|nr:hypothetical protein OIU74_020259 [Salix koriyanagi]